jgi:PhnB protein
MKNHGGPRPGFHTVTPYLIVHNAAEAIDFYVRGLGAEEMLRHMSEQGRVRHAELRIGDSMIMVTDESPEWPDWRGPLSYGGSPMHLYLYVPDVDALFARALAAGARELLPVQDHDYGDRSGGVIDPFGHTWYLATHIGDDAE